MSVRNAGNTDVVSLPTVSAAISSTIASVPSISPTSPRCPMYAQMTNAVVIPTIKTSAVIVNLSIKSDMRNITSHSNFKQIRSPVCDILHNSRAEYELSNCEWKLCWHVAR